MSDDDFRFSVDKMVDYITKHPHCEVTALLQVAIECIDSGDLDRAAWRIADAGALLRADMQRDGWQDVVGLDVETGRGAKLPKLRKEH